MMTPSAEDVIVRASPCHVLTSCVGRRNLLYTAFPDTTWYFKMLTNSFTFCGANNLISLALDILSNAALDGAKTVKGPLPSRSVTRLPALRAPISLDRSLLP